MEKQRYIKIDELTKNMLIFALYDVFKEEKKQGIPHGVTGNLILKLNNCTDKKLFFTDEEHRKTVLALNQHRNVRIAEGHHTECVDKVLQRLVQAKYKQCRS